MVGKPLPKAFHDFPPSSVQYTPNSVPTKSRLGSTWSSAKVWTLPRTGKSAVIFTQVLPLLVDFITYGLKSPWRWLLNNAYTTSGLWRDGSKSTTGVFAGIPGNVSLLVQEPPSLVLT